PLGDGFLSDWAWRGGIVASMGCSTNRLKNLVGPTGRILHKMPSVFRIDIAIRHGMNQCFLRSDQRVSFLCDGISDSRPHVGLIRQRFYCCPEAAPGFSYLRPYCP